MVDVIVEETNREGDLRYLEKYKKLLKTKPDTVQQFWKPMSEIELWGYLGLVITAGVEKSWNVPVRELFLDWRSDPIFSATFSVNRFEEIRRYMRFDNRATRDDRPEEGKLAPIKRIFDLFLSNAHRCYEPTYNLTLDEQLLGFYGRVGFGQFMPSKPAKQGMKIFWICDSSNSYALVGKIYSGKDGGNVCRDLAGKVTKELGSVFYNTGRTLTMDNYFTSLSTTEFLVERNLGVIGTIRSSKTFLPLNFVKHDKRPLHSSEFAFRPNMMLVSYVAKEKRVVNLITTVHNTTAVVEDNNNKPEPVIRYNKTKGGVDLMDQKVTSYTSTRVTRRWPMAMFYNIVDIAALNAEIVYHLSNPEVNAKLKDKRRHFLKNLGTELTRPQMASRLINNTRLPKKVIQSIGKFRIEVPQQPVVEPLIMSAQAKLETRTRCYKCSNDRKTSNLCQVCHVAVCKEHSRLICEFCIDKATF